LFSIFHFPFGKPKAKKQKQEMGQKLNWDEAALRRVCNGYNMIDTEKVVRRCKENPGVECADLKNVCHNALRQGKANVRAKNLKEANSNFALAYQARCMCDYIWVNVMNRKGDQGHAKFLQDSRDFGKLATEGLDNEAAAEVLKLIKNLH
jgi:hypothetical protein